MNGIERLLADLPPELWARTIRRMRAVASHEAASDPTDVADAAKRLGMTSRSFYRLIAAHRAFVGGRPPRPSRRGFHSGVPTEVDQEIHNAYRLLGPEAPLASVLRVATARCREKGLGEPSMTAVRCRRPKARRVDLKLRLRRRADLVLDCVGLGLCVIDDDGRVHSAMLSCVFHAGDGNMAHHLVSAGIPNHDAVADMLGSLPITVPGSASLVATGGIAPSVEPVPTPAAAREIVFDPLGSMGLQPGSAIMAVLGRRIGRVTVLPKKAIGSSAGEPVQIGIAAAVLGVTLERHPAGLDSPATTSRQRERST